MKPFLLILCLPAAVLLSGCETTVVARRHGAHRRVVYAERVSNDRVIYSNPSYRQTYYSGEVRYRTRGSTNRDFPSRSLDRSYAF